MESIIFAFTMSICLFVTLMLHTLRSHEKESSKDKWHNVIFIFVLFMLVLSSALYGVFSNRDMQKSIPQAIDVYRGKTELVITNKTIGNDVIIESDTLVRYKVTNE